MTECLTSKERTLFLCQPLGGAISFHFASTDYRQQQLIEIKVALMSFDQSRVRTQKCEGNDDQRLKHDIGFIFESNTVTTYYY